MSNIKNLWVVGNRLKEFANNKNIISLSELELLIHSNLFNDKTTKYIINYGQGVNELRLQKLRKRIYKLGLSELIKINIPVFCNQIIHKNKSENIMISEPIQCDSKNYLCALMLSNNYQITGQQIPSMVLVEAARQMVVAVCEKYSILDCYKGKSNIVMHSMDTTFSHFIFPLPVSIRYQILEFAIGINNSLTSKAHISFIQNGVAAAEMIFNFSWLESGVLAATEAEMAERCIQSQFENGLGDEIFI